MTDEAYKVFVWAGMVVGFIAGFLKGLAKRGTM